MAQRPTHGLANEPGEFIVKRSRVQLAEMVAVAVTVALLSGRVASPQYGSGTGAQDAEAAEVIAAGFEAPWSIAFFGDTPLISERDSARILELSPSGETRIVATVEGVAARGEGGLLGIAVHDEYLYACFTTNDDNRVERFMLRGERGSLTLGRSETVIDGIPAAGNHNGGRIAFGPDGMLYVTTGDAGDPNRAQDADSLGGKILRVTPDGTVPADNPFPGSPVFTLGHRNPQGIAWTEDGTMFASEFGQNTWDELNIIAAGGNYGWPVAEGIAKDERFVDPVQQWQPSEASPSGIAIAGETIYIANLRGERLREVPVSDALLAHVGDTIERFVDDYGRLRDVVVAPDGSLWILTNNTDGRGQPASGGVGGADDRIIRITRG